MTSRRIFAAVLLLCLSTLSHAALTPEARKLRAGESYSMLTSGNHPRLFADDAEFAEFKAAVEKGDNPYLLRLHARAMEIAEEYGQAADTIVPKMDSSNKRLLHVCKISLMRIFSAAYAYRFTGEERFLEHAERDMNTVCDFKTWNPSHFLDVGEMTAGVAIGYDWLYGHLSDSTRAKAVRAVKALSFDQADDEVNAWFYTSIHNWNQVCNGGLICAALAMYENFPEDARAIVVKGVESNRKAMAAMYAPDGAYPEGPGYWNYGNIYQCLLISSLESCLGTDFGLAGEPGFDRTGEYEIFVQGNTGRVFNYYDNGERITPHVPLWYMADRFGRPDYLYNEVEQLMDTPYSNLETDRLLPMFLLHAARISPDAIVPSERDCYFGDGITPVAMVRTGWEENDLYLGIKGGSASSNHGHADCGMFVYDAYGVRWAGEVERMSYQQLENPIKARGGSLWNRLQPSWRWKLFSYNNRQHNTLTVNDSTHNVDAVVPMVERYDSPERLGAAFNLTDLFFGDLAEARREVSIRDREYLEIRDCLKGGPADARVRWTLVGDGKANVTGMGILLSSKGKMVLLQTSAPDAVYKIYPSDPAEAGCETADFELPVPQHICGFEFTVPAGESLDVVTTITGVIR